MRPTVDLRASEDTGLRPNRPGCVWRNAWGREINKIFTMCEITETTLNDTSLFRTNYTIDFNIPTRLDCKLQIS
jgi:hypothetical protein